VSSGGPSVDDDGSSAGAVDLEAVGLDAHGLRGLADLAVEIAEDVGRHLIAGLNRPGPAISTKSTHTDLVTELDTWAEAHITEHLLAARPDDAVVGEEGVAVTGISGVTWCLDPIDGTVNFVHGIPGFCISIAAQVAGGDGEARSVVGVVHSPLHRETFVATLGGGATAHGGSGAAHGGKSAAHVGDAAGRRPIRCAEPETLSRAVIGTGFGYDPERRRRQAQVLVEVIPQIADIRRGGAAALDLCWVACGRLDGYWEVGLNPWDHAAGALIAREAGAVVEGPDRTAEPSSAFTLAASPAIVDDFRRILIAAHATDV
jgi:fructose-1,6-bisphosphatase/inositol monophosphatase family enzyme